MSPWEPTPGSRPEPAARRARSSLCANRAHSRTSPGLVPRHLKVDALRPILISPFARLRKAELSSTLGRPLLWRWPMSSLTLSTKGRVRRATFRLLALLCFYCVPQASVLVPGPGALPPDIFTMAGATFVAGLTTGPVLSSNGALTITVNTAVYSDPTNVFCAGCYDFVYQISNASTSRDSVGRVTGINFTG